MRKIIVIMSAAFYISLCSDEPRLLKHELYWEHHIRDVWYSLEAATQTFTQPSSQKSREYMYEKNYESILDIGCGCAPEYYGFILQDKNIHWQGVDITPKVLSFCKEKKLPVCFGHAESLPFNDSSYDVVFTRHLLEHLKYYKKAISEMIRVAKQEVMIVFFLPPLNAPDDIKYSMHENSALFNNCYNKKRLEDFIMQHQKVASIEWQILENTVAEGNEAILHVLLQSPIDMPNI